MSLIEPGNIEDKVGFEEFEKMGLFEYDPSNSIAYTRSIFKTMCLFYDQVYIDHLDFTQLLVRGERLPKDAVFLSKEITRGIANYMTPENFSSMSSSMTTESEKYAFTKGVVREANKHDIYITPVYGTIFGHAGQKVEGEGVDTIQLAIDLFPGIKEDDLEWGQVDEVRNDINSVGGFRRVRDLISAIQECNSKIEANDLIRKKIEDYKKACSKHGIDTAKNLFAQVCKKETFISAIGSAMATGSIEAGAAIGGIKLLGDIGITAYESVVDRDRLNNQHPVGATAVIYEENFDD